MFCYICLDWQSGRCDAVGHFAQPCGLYRAVPGPWRQSAGVHHHQTPAHALQQGGVTQNNHDHFVHIGHMFCIVLQFLLGECCEGTSDFISPRNFRGHQQLDPAQLYSDTTKLS